MTENGFYNSKISRCKPILIRLKEFCEENCVTIPDLVYFWILEAESMPRTCFFSAVGADISNVFHSICDTHFQESSLREINIEAHNSEGRILSDGLLESDTTAPRKPVAAKFYKGKTFFGSKISAALLGVRKDNETVLSPKQWLDRVSLSVILSPATSVLGNVEVDLIRMLHKTGRPFFLIVTGLTVGDPSDRVEFINEIKDYKLYPLTNETGDFPVFFLTSDKDSDLDELKNVLSEWIQNKKMISQFKQFCTVGNEWFLEVEEVWTNRVLKENHIIQEVDEILQHMNQKIARFTDIVSHLCLKTENKISACYFRIEEECDKAAQQYIRWIKDPIGNENQIFKDIQEAWIKLFDVVKNSTESIYEGIKNAFEEESTDFFESYRDTLNPWHSEWKKPSFIGYNKEIKKLESLSYEDFNKYIMKLAEITKQQIIDSNEKDNSCTDYLYEMIKNIAIADEGIENINKNDETDISEDPISKSPLYQKTVNTIKGLYHNVSGKSDPENTRYLLNGGMLDALNRFLKPSLKNLMLTYRREVIIETRNSTQRSFDLWRTQIVDQVNNIKGSLDALEKQGLFKELYHQWRSSII